MVAERRVASIGRVDEGVALVESPPGLDADLFRPCRRRHLQLHGEGNLEAGRDDSSIRRRVVKDRPDRGCQAGGWPDDCGPPPGSRRGLGAAPGALRVRPPGHRRAAPAGRTRCRRRRSAPGPSARSSARASSTDADPEASVRFALEEEVAHDDHSPADGNRQTGDVDVLGHVRSIVAVGRAAGR